MGWTFDVGDAFNIFLLASVASGFFSVTLLSLYRRSVRQMVKSDSTRTDARSTAHPAVIPSLDYRRADATDTISQIYNEIRRRRGMHLRMYVVAGAVYAALATVAVSFLFHVSAWALILFVAATYCWPPLAVLHVAFEGRRRLRIVGSYLLILLVFAGLLPLAATSSERIGTVPPFAWGPFIWGAAMIVPTVLLVPVLAGGLRAIGPIMLSLFVVTFFLFRVMLSSPGLAFGVVDRVGSFIVGELRLDVAIGLFLALIFLVCLSLGFAAAWLIGRWHRGKHFSDQSLAVSAIVLTYTLWLLLLSSAIDWRPTRFSVLLVFASFVLTLMVQRRVSRRPATGPRLLLLRAFDPADPRRQRRFFRALQSEWRYVGPLQIVGGPDLATDTVEPARFLQFLSGNLRSLFLVDSAQVWPAIDALDEKADPDGRFRINELFCRGTVWRSVVADLAARSPFVVMDVSNFRGQRGLTEELHMLPHVVELGRVMFLVGGSEDTARFRHELAVGVASAPAGSPNAHGRVQVQELSVEGRPADAVDRMLRSLHNHDGNVTYPVGAMKGNA